MWYDIRHEAEKMSDETLDRYDVGDETWNEIWGTRYKMRHGDQILPETCRMT